MKAAWMMFANTRVFTSCYNMEELNENSTCSILLCLQVKLFSLLTVVYFEVINFTLPVQDMEVKRIIQNAQGYKGRSRISQGGEVEAGQPQKYEAKTPYLAKFEETISRVFIKTEKIHQRFLIDIQHVYGLFSAAHQDEITA